MLGSASGRGTGRHGKLMLRGTTNPPKHLGVALNLLGESLKGIIAGDKPTHQREQLAQGSHAQAVRLVVDYAFPISPASELTAAAPSAATL